MLAVKDVSKTLRNYGFVELTLQHVQGTNYSKLRNSLKKSSIGLNLKMLAQLSVLDKKTFSQVLQEANSN